MALRPEEIFRIKLQLGVSITLLGAEPYITYLAIFDRAIQPFIVDPSTSSATVVVAGATQAITLAAVPLLANTQTPAFSPGSFVTVDFGPASEVVQLVSLVGTVAWATFVNAHGSTGGAYNVAMAGGEQIVREILARIAAIELQMSLFAPQAAGVEKLDEISLYASTPSGARRGSRDMFDALTMQREAARDDLGEAVGFTNLRRTRRTAGSRVELY